jgi:E3 ubiquitin-protein ligase UBR2
MCLLFEVLHLIGMALQEERQHLENAVEEHVVTFTFTQKISSMYTLSAKLRRSK